MYIERNTGDQNNDCRKVSDAAGTWGQQDPHYPTPPGLLSLLLISASLHWLILPTTDISFLQ